MCSVKNKIGRINVRIALLFSALFLGAILTLFSVVFFIINRSLQGRETAFIQHKLLAYWALSQAQGIEAFVREIREENLLLEGTPFFLRLSDGENRTLYLARPEDWKEFLRDPEQSLPQDPERFLTLRSPTRSYHLIAGGIPISAELFLQVGISTEERERIFSLLVRSFSLLLVPLTAASFLLGALLTSRTLAPLQGLTLRVQEIIRTGNLSERVPAPVGRNELQDLVTLFNAMLDRISQLVRSMRQTLDTVAHDLRTPLTRLRGSAELALRSEDPLRWKEALEDSMEESEKLLRMMNTILDIAAAEAGTLPLQLSDIDLGALLQDMVDLYSFPAEEKEVKIQLSLPEQPLWIKADPNRMRQVVGNLLDNAIKYSPPRTTVRVEADRKDPWTTLRVKDQGMGIDPEDLPHIWERLYRGKGTRTVPGLGLGLSLVKAVVEAHGGTIQASSDPAAGGALFEVSIPASAG